MLVIGAGVSGRAAALYLLSQGKRVVVVDRNPQKLSDLPASDRLECCIESEFNGFDEIEEVVLSSGVRPIHPFMRDFPVVGEAELVLRATSQRCIGITGTNGKTTVTMLVEHALQSAGLCATAVGNVGKALAEYGVSPRLDEILVVELSSYQLETLCSPVFDAAVILNITPDHLDQYHSMEEYARAKCRLQKCMKPGTELVVQKEVAKQFGHMLQQNVQLLEDKKIASLLPLRYRNRHECENASAAWEMVRGFGVSWESFLNSLETFKKPSHRIEFVAEIAGVTYWDDSKGTNVDAVIQAVHVMEGPVLLIAGGVDKGSSYKMWILPFTHKVKKMYVIGQAAMKMQEELSSTFEMVLCTSLDDAVERAHRDAREGECILLSPGCASFDMFRDYAHRGDEFKRCVDNLRRK